MNAPLGRLLRPRTGAPGRLGWYVRSRGALMNQNHSPGKQLGKIDPGYGELFSPTQFYFTFLPRERSQIRWKVAFTKISSPF